MKHQPPPFLLLIIFTLVLIASLSSETLAIPPLNYGEGDAGTIRNPYLIDNLANLRWLSETPEVWGMTNGMRNKQYFRQTADIDAIETVEWNNGRGFFPIGRSIYNTQMEILYLVFHSEYDGDNYTISNLYAYPNELDSPFLDLHSHVYGLFGYLWETSIQNIGLEHINYQIHTDRIGQNSTGSALAGFVYHSTIMNCYVTGGIFIFTEPQSEPGMSFLTSGLANIVSGGSIQNSYSTVKITVFGNPPSSFLGGLVLMLLGSSITNSYYYGELSSDSLAPKNSLVISASEKSTIENCYFVCNTQEYDYAVASSLYQSEILYSFWDQEVSNMHYPVEIVTDSIITCSLGYKTAAMKQISSYLHWDFANIWNINPEINNGYPFLRNLPLPTLREYEPHSPDILQNSLVNFPNPFNPSTLISFIITAPTSVQINIYNIKGQKIRALLNTDLAIGKHEVQWNGENDHGQLVGSGIYLYNIQTNKNTAVKKMVLMK